MAKYGQLLGVLTALILCGAFLNLRMNPPTEIRKSFSIPSLSAAEVQSMLDSNFERVSALFKDHVTATASSTNTANKDAAHFGIPYSPTALVGTNARIPMIIKECSSSALAMTAQFALIKNNMHVGQAFMRGDWWEDSTIASFLRTYDDKGNKENCNMLDLGANMGAWTVAFALKGLTLGANCQVYAFETQAAMYLNLLANIGINGLPNVNVYNVAVVHKDGASVTMADSGNPPLEKIDKIDYKDFKNFKNYGGRSIGKGSENRLIAGVKLDSMDLKRVGMLKIDIQGSETLAFWGMRQLIERDKPLITSETTDEFSNEATLNLIAGAFNERPSDEQLRFDWKGWLLALGYTSKVMGPDTFFIPPPSN